MHPDAKNPDRRITYFAATHTRGKREMFGIRAEDRGKHIYVIGKTGMGKSTMLENMAIQDIQNGEGLAFVDPHGATAEKLLDFVPQGRIKDVVYFAPFDTDYPIGFNVMEDVGFDKRHLVVSGLMGALKRIWVDAWSARMEYILQNTLLALLEYPGSTLLDVNRMLTNKTFRSAVVEKVTDPLVRSFWLEEFAAFTDTYTREATPAIQNKIGQFTANPLIRNIVGQSKSTFDLRKIMDEQKIFIVNLSKGRMGETNAALLGSMLVVKIYLAAMSRAEEPAARMARLPRFYFYVDEFQSMMNEAFADILSESRKYKLALTLANQYIEQMEENVRDAVFGNIGTLICFRVGPFDADVLETVFDPTFTPEDLVGLGIGQIYLTLMIDGVGSRPFSAETIPPIESPAISYRDDVIRNSRAEFGRARAEIEAGVNKRQLEFVQPPKPKKSSNYSGTRAREGASLGGNNNERPRTLPRGLSASNAQAGAPAWAGTPADRSLWATPAAAEIRTSKQAALGNPDGSAFRSRDRNVQSRSVQAPINNSNPNPGFPANQSAPGAFSHEKAETERSLLKDAIEKATKGNAAPVSSGRSPADILRERMNVSKRADPANTAGQPPAKRQNDQAAGNRESEEISPDLLRSVLNGKGKDDVE